MLTNLTKKSIVRGLALILATLMAVSMCLVGCTDADAQSAAKAAAEAAKAAQDTANEAKAAATAAVTSATVDQLISTALAAYLKTADAYNQSAALTDIANALKDSGYTTKDEVTKIVADYVSGVSSYTKAEIDAMLTAEVAKAVADAKAYADALVAKLSSDTGVDAAVVEEYLAKHDLAWDLATEEIQKFTTEFNKLLLAIKAKTYTGEDWEHVYAVLKDCEYVVFTDVIVDGKPTGKHVANALVMAPAAEILVYRTLNPDQFKAVLDLMTEAKNVVTITDKIDDVIAATETLLTEVELKDIDAWYFADKAVGAASRKLTWDYGPAYVADTQYIYPVFDKTVNHAKNEVYWLDVTKTEKVDGVNVTTLVSSTLVKLTADYVASANKAPEYEVVKSVSVDAAGVAQYKEVVAKAEAVIDYLTAQTKLDVDAEANLVFGGITYHLAHAVADFFMEVAGQGSLKWAKHLDEVMTLVNARNHDAYQKIWYAEEYLDYIDGFEYDVKYALETYYDEKGQVKAPASDLIADQMAIDAANLLDGVKYCLNVFAAQEADLIARTEKVAADLLAAKKAYEDKKKADADSAAEEAAKAEYAAHKVEYKAYVAGLVATLTAEYNDVFAALKLDYSLEASMTTLDYADKRVATYYLAACEIDEDAAMTAILALKDKKDHNDVKMDTWDKMFAEYKYVTYEVPAKADFAESYYKDTLYATIAAAMNEKVTDFAAFFTAVANTTVTDAATEIIKTPANDGPDGIHGNADDVAAVYYTVRENLAKELKVVTDAVAAKIAAITVNAENAYPYTKAVTAIVAAAEEGFLAVADKYLEVIEYKNFGDANKTEAKADLDDFYTDEIVPYLTSKGATGSKPAVETIKATWQSKIDAIAIDATNAYPYLTFMGTALVKSALDYSSAAIADYIDVAAFPANGAYEKAVKDGEIAMLKDAYSAVITSIKGEKVATMNTEYTAIITDATKSIKGNADREAAAQILFNKAYKNVLDYELTYSIVKDGKTVAVTFEEYAATMSVADLMTAMTAKIDASSASVGAFAVDCTETLVAYEAYCAAYDTAVNDVATEAAAKLAVWAYTDAEKKEPAINTHRQAAINAYKADGLKAVDAAMAVYKIGETGKETVVDFKAYVNDKKDISVLKAALVALYTASETAMSTAVTNMVAKMADYNAVVADYEANIAKAQAQIANAAAVNAAGLTEAQADVLAGDKGAYKGFYVDGSLFANAVAEFAAAVAELPSELPTAVKDSTLTAWVAAQKLATTKVSKAAAKVKDMIDTLDGAKKADLTALVVFNWTAD